MTGGRGSLWGDDRCGALARVVRAAPADARLMNTGRTFPAGLALVSRCGLPIRSDADATGTPADGLLRIVWVPVGAFRIPRGEPRGSRQFFGSLGRSNRWPFSAS